MNAKSLIAALVATLAAAGAFAQEATYERPQPSTSTVTRAQVMAELARAQASGELAYGERGMHSAPTMASMKTREEVKAELAAARADGTLDLLNGDASKTMRAYIRM